MVLERLALSLNNALAVATTGRNAFFPNKPKAFHDACANHARASLLVVSNQPVLRKNEQPDLTMGSYGIRSTHQLTLELSDANFYAIE